MLGHEKIDLNKLTQPEIIKLKRRKKFLCVVCKKPVILRNGEKKRAHFAHQKEGISTSQHESAAHILVKHTMVKWLKNQNIEAKIEKRFSAIERIADVYFEYKGAKYIMEIQRSSMSNLELKERIRDYQSIGAAVLWIFIGDIIKKEHTVRLPPVMLGRGLSRIFHFCIQSANFQIFDSPIFVTTRDIYTKPICRQLNGFQIADLLSESSFEGLMHCSQSWLEIKRKFRRYGWFHATKSEKKLLEQCLIRGFNLSLLPTEIGWPVAGNAINKHLFIWQSYVLLTMMKHFNIGDIFSLDRLVKLLKIEYQVIMRDGAYDQVNKYLKWLLMFGIVKENNGDFEYIKLPKVEINMEAYLSRDKRFVDTVAKLWKV